MIRCAVVIPCYNEEAAIANVVAGINELNLQSANSFSFVPVVVNDCSKDNSWNIVSSLNCVGINLPVNLGIGGAVQAGFLFALKNNFDCAIQIDGDGQHPASEIPKLTALLESNDVVIGSRFVEGSRIGFQSSFTRRIGIRFLSKMVGILTGSRYFDITSGMRLYSFRALKVITPHYPDDFPEPVALITCIKHKLKIQEIQVEMLERQGGESSIKSLKTVYYMLKVSLAMISARFKPLNNGR